MITYEELTAIAHEAKKDFRIKSPAKKKIRVGAPFAKCLQEMKRNRFTAHCHVYKDHYGRICMFQNRLDSDEEAIKTVYHEVLHFRYLRHTDKFRRELYFALRVRETRLNTTTLPSVSSKVFSMNSKSERGDSK